MSSNTAPRPQGHPLPTLVVAAVAMASSACAGAPRGPDVPQPEAPALFAAFNGSWTLAPDESSSPTSPNAGSGRRPRGPGEATGFLPPRGGTGDRGRGRRIPPGGGGRGVPGGGGGGGGRPIPSEGPREASPVDASVLLSPLPALELTVTDSTLAVTPRDAEPDSTGAQPPRIWPRPDPYRLRLDGEEARASIARVFMNVTARWDGRAIAVERKVENGPEVTELWTVDQAAGRLIITRTIDLPRGPKIEQKQVYRRASGTSSFE